MTCLQCHRCGSMREEAAFCRCTTDEEIAEWEAEQRREIMRAADE